MSSVSQEGSSREEIPERLLDIMVYDGHRETGCQTDSANICACVCARVRERRRKVKEAGSKVPMSFHKPP